jgi:acetyl esterase/lipase
MLEKLFNLIASERGIDIREAITYGPLLRYRLDVYKANSIHAKPVVAVFYYGGGWRSGERSMYRFVGTALAARGITTIIPDYRIFPEAGFPDFMEDAARAYAWVDANIAATPAGKRPVVLIGHSAGAYIAALLALDTTYRHRFAPDSHAPAGLVGLAGPYAFDPTTWPTTREIFAATNPDQARPVAFAHAGAPPSLLLYGLSDSVVRPFNVENLATALAHAGNRVERLDYPSLGHLGLITALGRPLRWRAPVLDDIVGFIDRLPRRTGAHDARAAVDDAGGKR